MKCSIPPVNCNSYKYRPRAGFNHSYELSNSPCVHKDDLENEQSNRSNFRVSFQIVVL